MYIRNGTTTNLAVDFKRASGTASISNTLSRMVYLTTGDSIAVYAIQASGTDKLLDGTAGYSWFDAHWVAR